MASMAGDRPKLSEDGMLSTVWYGQKVAIINGIVSAVVFGWLKATALTLCAFVAINWQSDQPMSRAQMVRRLFPRVFVVWLVIIVTQTLGNILAVALVLPYLLISPLWYLATFVAADENVGVLQSLKKSYAVVRPNWRLVFTLVCLFWLVGVGLGLFQAMVLIPSFQDSGIAVQYWAHLIIAFRDIAGLIVGFANMIVLSATYLVLKRAHLGPSRNELKFVFD